MWEDIDKELQVWLDIQNEMDILTLQLNKEDVNRYLIEMVEGSNKVLESIKFFKNKPKDSLLDNFVKLWLNQLQIINQSLDNCVIELQKVVQKNKLDKINNKKQSEDYKYNLIRRLDYFFVKLDIEIVKFENITINPVFKDKVISNVIRKIGYF